LFASLPAPLLLLLTASSLLAPRSISCPSCDDDQITMAAATSTAASSSSTTFDPSQPTPEQAFVCTRHHRTPPSTTDAFGSQPDAALALAAVV